MFIPVVSGPAAEGLPQRSKAASQGPGSQEVLDPVMQTSSALTVARKGMHITIRCPSDAALFSEGVRPRMGGSKGPLQPRELTRSGQVEGHHVDDILLDTGCSWTLVKEQLVLEEKLLEGQPTTIWCAHGDSAVSPH